MKNTISIVPIGLAIFGLVEIALIGASYLLVGATNVAAGSEVIDVSVLR